MRQGCLPTTPTYMDGLFTAVNAVPDIHLVMDCPGCGYDKPGKTGVNHDLASSLISWSRRHRVFYTHLDANDLVMGTEAKLKYKVREIVADQNPSLIMIVQSSAILLTGADADADAAELETETGVPTAVVPSKTLSGDYLDGYAAALETLARRVPLETKERRPDSIAFVGNMMDRMEEDQRANVRELSRICCALSAPVASIWLDGSEFGALASVADAGRIISLPYGRAGASALAARLGVPVSEMELPVGLDGAVRWTRALAETLGREKEAEQLIGRELEEIVPRIEWAVRRTLMNRNVALAADPYTAPGLISFFYELGMHVKHVALRTRKQADAAKTLEALSAAGQSAEVITDPSFPELESAWLALREAEKLDLIVASGSERDAAKGIPVPFLEIGYPCYVRHALYDAPWIGFRGALWLADRIFNLLSEWEYVTY